MICFDVGFYWFGLGIMVVLVWFCDFNGLLCCFALFACYLFTCLLDVASVLLLSAWCFALNCASVLFVAFIGFLLFVCGFIWLLLCVFIGCGGFGLLLDLLCCLFDCGFAFVLLLEFGFGLLR